MRYVSDETAKADSQTSAVEAEKQPSTDDSIVVVRPEVVRCKNVHVADGLKTLTMGNANGDYLLSCNMKAAGCITPEPGKDFLLFNKNTHWKMPGAKTYIDLAFVQDWTVTYNQSENIGLVPQGDSATGLGIFMLDSWSKVPSQ